MPSSPKLPDEKVQKIVALRKQGLGITEIGRQLGLHRETVRKYAKTYVPQGGAPGEPPPGQPIDQVIDRTDIDGSVDVLKSDKILSPGELMEACGLDPRTWIPQYFKPNTWEGFYSLPAGGGHRKVKLYQSKAVFKRIIAEEVEHAILDYVREHVTPFPVGSLAATRPLTGKPFVAAWGIWDAHIGLYAWQSEVGADFDVKIATARVMNSIDDMIEELRPYRLDKIWMPIGNDFMHFDNVRHKTAFGEHFLDTDTRYAKVYQAALECLIYMVQRALELTPHLDLMYIPGNHDLMTSFTLCCALQQRFMNDPRVTVDLGANPRKWRTHGGTLIMFDHGRDMKLGQYPLVLGQEAKSAWSQSTYREIQVGDKHQRFERQHDGLIPTNGVLIRRNPALCNADAWHHNQGFIGEPVKSVEAWRYDETGYRGSHCVWARDERVVQ